MIESTVAVGGGQPIDGVLVSNTEPSWGVVEVGVAGSGQIAQFVLVSYAGSWSAVASGYPQIPCFPTAPAPVRADLGDLMAPCG